MQFEKRTSVNLSWVKILLSSVLPRQGCIAIAGQGQMAVFGWISPKDPRARYASISGRVTRYVHEGLVTTYVGMGIGARPIG